MRKFLCVLMAVALVASLGAVSLALDAGHVAWSNQGYYPAPGASESAFWSTMIAPGKEGEGRWVTKFTVPSDGASIVINITADKPYNLGGEIVIEQKSWADTLRETWANVDAARNIALTDSGDLATKVALKGGTEYIFVLTDLYWLKTGTVATVNSLSVLDKWGDTIYKVLGNGTIEVGGAAPTPAPEPSAAPTTAPTTAPTAAPTAEPSAIPSVEPMPMPTVTPIVWPAESVIDDFDRDPADKDLSGDVNSQGLEVWWNNWDKGTSLEDGALKFVHSGDGDAHWGIGVANPVEANYKYLVLQVKGTAADLIVAPGGQQVHLADLVTADGSAIKFTDYYQYITLDIDKSGLKRDQGMHLNVKDGTLYVGEIFYTNDAPKQLPVPPVAEPTTKPAPAPSADDTAKNAKTGDESFFVLAIIALFVSVTVVTVVAKKRHN